MATDNEAPGEVERLRALVVERDAVIERFTQASSEHDLGRGSCVCELCKLVRTIDVTDLHA